MAILSFRNLLFITIEQYNNRAISALFVLIRVLIFVPIRVFSEEPHYISYRNNNHQ